MAHGSMGNSKETKQVYLPGDRTGFWALDYRVVVIEMASRLRQSKADSEGHVVSPHCLSTNDRGLYTPDRARLMPE